MRCRCEVCVESEHDKKKEGKMTVICRACQHHYGRWRDHCPTCGTATPPEPRAVVAARRRPRDAHARRSKTECIFCRQRGAKETCPHCNELIHKYCQSLHENACKQFQIEREEALRDVS